MQGVRSRDASCEDASSEGGKDACWRERGSASLEVLLKSSDTSHVSDYEQSNGCQANNICSTYDIPKATVLD
jgi:hypothetical protein